MEVHGCPEDSFGGSDASNMVDMRVRQQYVADGQRMLFRKRQKLLDFITRIDQHSFPRLFAPDHKPVLEERPNGSDLQ
jgi:hypothetical protein